MTLHELKESGRKMAEKAADKRTEAEGRQEIEDNLRGLSNDPRLAALFALLHQTKESYTTWVATGKMAIHHGPLAHCAGGLDAILRFEQALAAAFSQRPAKQSKAPQEEE